MSHLGNSTQSTNPVSVIEYSPAEYRKLSRQKNFWFVGALTITFAEIFLLYAGAHLHPIMFIAALVMVWPAGLHVLKAADVGYDFRRNQTVTNRQFVREVRKLLNSYAQKRPEHWARSASFAPEVSVLKFRDRHLNDMSLRLIPRDPSLATHEYRVSPTGVKTVRGIDLMEIFDDVKRLLAVEGRDEVADVAIGATFHRVVSDYSDGERRGVQLPAGALSPLELMGN